LLKTQLENNFDTGIQFLKSKNEKFKKLEEIVGSFSYNSGTLNFESLVKIIINQQLSNNVATSIFNKLKSNFINTKTLTPQDLIKLRKSKFKDCGISKSKTGFIQNIAEELNNNPNLLQNWINMNDEKAFFEITKYKGFGPWSANIILLSCLGRQDILPYNDATIQKAILSLYGFKLNKNNFDKLNWAKPYRSIMCMYLWRWVDGGMIKIS
tara:strand:+ start:238 stop:870 length:633 start_codon:yes stop_codon:yes gene_type:complete